jgi:hypothetical protein
MRHEMRMYYNIWKTKKGKSIHGRRIELAPVLRVMIRKRIAARLPHQPLTSYQVLPRAPYPLTSTQQQSPLHRTITL